MLVFDSSFWVFFCNCSVNGMVFIFIKFSPKFPAFFAKLSPKSWLPSTKFGGDRGQTLDGIPELHLFRGVSEVATELGG